MKRLWLFMVVILLLTVVACGNDEEPSVESSNTSPRRATTSPNNTTTDTTSELDLWPNVIDDLAFVQGQTLYVQRAGQTETQSIAPMIFPPSLALTPDGQYIAYNEIVSIRSRYITIADVETLEPRQLYRSSGDFAFLGPASPDGQWVIIFNFPSMYLANIDGVTSRRVASIQNFGVTPFWLEDSTLLVVIQQNGAVQEVRRYDPTADEDIPIVEQAASAIGETVAAGLNGVSAFVPFQDLVHQELGVDLQGAIQLNTENPIPVINLVGPPANAQGIPAMCGTWQITRETTAVDTQIEELLTVRDTVFLTNNLTLADGSIVFVRWYFEDCDNAKMRASLVKLTPDGETETIIEGIDPGTSRNLGFFFADTGPHIAYSSDGQYAIWIGGGLDQGESSINITDLMTGVTSQLHHVTRDSSNAATFHTDTAYTAVMLVPRS
ncbi:MAG: hypothetical protein H6673_07350 [Anaerolineales bacterium]|nr:hypothetical protein [Anaerolineales bacterium]